MGLVGRTKTAHEPGTQDYYQYDIHIVPTQFVDYPGNTINTHQYSSTEMHKVVHRHDHAPGIFLVYDITPFTAQVVESAKPFGSFCTQVCALIGGIFAFGRLVDRVGYFLARVAARKLVSATGRSVVPS